MRLLVELCRHKKEAISEKIVKLHTVFSFSEYYLFSRLDPDPTFYFDTDSQFTLDLPILILEKKI